MASLLLAAGSPGMRHSLPNARIMIHQPSGGVQVKALMVVNQKILELHLLIITILRQYDLISLNEI